MPIQNSRHFKCIFFNENAWISIKISLKFVAKDSINSISALVQIMAWRLTDAYMRHSASTDLCLCVDLVLDKYCDSDTTKVMILIWEGFLISQRQPQTHWLNVFSISFWPRPHFATVQYTEDTDCGLPDYVVHPKDAHEISQFHFVGPIWSIFFICILLCHNIFGVFTLLMLETEYSVFRDQYHACWCSGS